MRVENKCGSGTVVKSQPYAVRGLAPNRYTGEYMRKTFVIFNVLIILFISALLILPAIKSWHSPASLIDLLMAACLLLSTYCWVKAMSLLSTEGQDQFWHITLWSKLSAGQENFTPAGWRYWRLLRYSLLLLLLLFLSRSIVRVIHT